MPDSHDRLLRIETTAEDALRNDHYDQQLRKLAEVGAALCGYSAGDPERWAKGTCDCKFLPEMFSVLWREQTQLRGFTSEMTGCCEVRHAWRALEVLRNRAIERRSRVI